MVETTGLHPQLDTQPLFPGEDLAMPCMPFARPEEADGVGGAGAGAQAELQPPLAAASVYSFARED